MDYREQAKALLYDGNFTCVLYDGHQFYTNTKRGVAPLLQWLDDEHDYSAFSAADKVIGKGAAFLYILLGIKTIFAKVISEPSLHLLHLHHIDVEYETLVPAIRNRDNTGFCPIETAVMGIDDIETALEQIRKTTAALSGK